MKLAAALIAVVVPMLIGAVSYVLGRGARGPAGDEADGETANSQERHGA